VTVLDVRANPTLIVQEFPAVRLPSQVFVSLKGAAVVMPMMVRSALPKSLKFIGGFGVDVHTQPQLGGAGRHSSLQEMETLVVDNIAFGPATTPIPVRAMDAGLPAASLVMASDADRGPTCVGVKVMLIEHVVPGARLEPHVSVSEKSVAFVPLTATPLTFIGCAPTLVSTTCWAALPTCNN